MLRRTTLKANKTFATTINCMDGRVQLPVIEYLMKELGADYIDSITEPGPIKILSENKAVSTIESIRKRVSVSVEKHLSRSIAIIGHHDCGGNPAEREEQIEQINESCSLVQKWQPNVQVYGLWVDENWTVHRI